MRNAIMVAAAALAISAAPAIAQTTETTPKTQKPGDHMTQKNADQAFVMKAAEGGLAEVELGKLAAQNAHSDEVKKFGQRMVDDHGKANDELKTLAQQKNITIPTDLTAKEKALRDKLASLKGEQFDREYMHAMLTDHEKDVAAFRTESKSGKDAEVKAWAGKTLPTLEDHLKEARDANRAVGTSGVKK